MRVSLCQLLVWWALFTSPAFAVLVEPTGTETTAPTSSNIPNWETGWTQPAIQPSGYSYTTGWNYVGQIINANGVLSGVYIGNGWVLTCAHVMYSTPPSGGNALIRTGTFNLNGAPYTIVSDSFQTYFTSTGSGTFAQADIIAFRVTPYPDLPVLPIRSSDPVGQFNGAGTSNPGPYTYFAMIGYGDGTGGHSSETWGYNQVYQSPYTLTLTPQNFVTTDYASVPYTYSASAYYYASVGDSGGGSFIYNSSSKRWELAGMIEAYGNPVQVTWQGQSYNSTPSFLVQLDSYYAQVQQTLNWTPPIDSPTMPEWGLIFLGLILLVAAGSQIAEPSCR